MIFLKRIQDDDIEQKTIVHWQPKAKNLLDILSKEQIEIENGNYDIQLQKKKPRPHRLINGEVVIKPGRIEEVKADEDSYQLDDDGTVSDNL